MCFVSGKTFSAPGVASQRKAMGYSRMRKLEGSWQQPSSAETFYLRYVPTFIMASVSQDSGQALTRTRSGMMIFKRFRTPPTQTCGWSALAWRAERILPDLLGTTDPSRVRSAHRNLSLSPSQHRAAATRMHRLPVGFRTSLTQKP